MKLNRDERLILVKAIDILESIDTDDGELGEETAIEILYKILYETREN